MESIKESKVFETLNQIANLNFENLKPCCNEQYLFFYFLLFNFLLRVKDCSGKSAVERSGTSALVRVDNSIR